MTFREKLADWISGGKLTLYRDQNRHCVKSMYAIEDKLAALRGQVVRIKSYTAPQKSGTAKKVTRMCREALGE